MTNEEATKIYREVLERLRVSIKIGPCSGKTAEWLDAQAKASAEIRQVISWLFAAEEAE